MFSSTDETSHSVLKQPFTIKMKVHSFTAVSSDSRPPNPKRLTAIIAFDI